MMAMVKEKVVGVRMPEDLKRAIEQDAQKSGISLSEQIRFELAVRRGLWRQPVLPDERHPMEPSRKRP